MKMIFNYFRLRAKFFLLYLLLLFLLFAVYGLYGLPFGPAQYTALLLSLVCVLFCIADFFSFAKKLRYYAVMQNQLVALPNGVPFSPSPTEEALLAVICQLSQRAQAAETAHTAQLSATNEYYTLWSHQIKTPLAAMRLLLQEPEPDTDALLQELFKTEQYVEMVLDYQRLKMSTKDLVLQEYPLNTLVHKAVMGVSTLIIHKKLSLDLAELHGIVLTDEKWLIFVLEQLLTNAAKYTARGTISIYQSADAPHLLVVEDTGIGIRPEDLPRVCEQGYTGCNGRLEEHSTGIGLALCKQVMAMLGHSFTITSVLGKGTRVTLDLGRKKLETE